MRPQNALFRPALEFTALHATLLLAALVHAVLLFAYATLCTDAGSSDYKFFEDVELIEQHATVTLTKVAPAPRTPPDARAQPVSAPTRPEPNPGKPVAVQKPGPTQHARTRSRVIDVPPPVVAHVTRRGPRLPVGDGRGMRGGDPDADGTGDGAPRKAAPAEGGSGGGPRGEPTISVPNYDNYLHLPEQVRPPSPPSTEICMKAAVAKNWQQLCEIYGMDYEKLTKMAHVDPYCLGQDNPALYGTDRLNGKKGTVRIICDIDADGHPRPQIVASGDELLDRVAYQIALHTYWLPALDNGIAAACRIDYSLHFSTYSRGARCPDPNAPEMRKSLK